MTRKRPITERGARRRAERERTVGLDPDDEAARWLGEHDPKPLPPARPPKSKLLHRWRQEQQRGDERRS